jgi:transposase-like protein
MNAIQPREVSAVITRLRAEIEQLPINAAGKRRNIPLDLKRRIVRTFASADMKAGEFSRAVSISLGVFCRWRRELDEGNLAASRTPGVKAPPGFRKIAISPEPESPKERLTIEGPNGLKVTGLTVNDLVRVWKALC